ncbi:TOBE domain-containing protein [Saccharomonospora xinjiangensis]|uniref:TOBE domain-containing protein n=1 Tax=Saccharomonospora xinjiangensis TaxID=75294 RepID=UPI001FFD1CB2|nr:TOBE domain-containing protein [Saccharomonospora xinjiangensis]
MRDGAVVQCAAPTSVYDEPADTFVGGFLGSPPMNFLTGTVGHDGTALRLDLGGQSVPVPPALASYAGSDLTLGIRPESVTVEEPGATASADDTATVRGALQVLEPLGSAVLLTTEVCGQTVKVQAPAPFRTEPSSALRLRIPAGQCRWYNPETGLLLEVS